MVLFLNLTLVVPYLYLFQIQISMAPLTYDGLFVAVIMVAVGKEELQFSDAYFHSPAWRLRLLWMLSCSHHTCDRLFAL